MSVDLLLKLPLDRCKISTHGCEQWGRAGFRDTKGIPLKASWEFTPLASQIPSFLAWFKWLLQIDAPPPKSNLFFQASRCGFGGPPFASRLLRTLSDEGGIIAGVFAGGSMAAWKI